MNHSTTLIAMGAAFIAQTAQADDWSNATPGAYDSPGGYVTWDRGTSGTAYAQWDVFYQPEGTNHATDGVFGGDAPMFDSLDLLGNPNPFSGSTAGTGIGASSITQLNTGVGAIITSTSNLYSFGGTAAYSMVISDVSSFSSLVITTMTSGSPMDYSSFSIDSGSIESSQTLSDIGAIETQWLIDLSANTLDDVTITFNGSAAHMSLMKVSADVYAVPTPGAFALLGVAGLFASRRRS